MKVIKGLMIKDLLQLKNYKKTLIAFLIIFVLTGITQQSLSQAGNMLIVMITLGFGMFAMATFNYDELAKAEKYILTFPVTKKEVVRSKYILVGLATLMGAIIGCILTIILTFVMEKSLANLADIAMIALGSIFGISLVEALQIPCIIKSGAEKGRIQMFIAVIVVAAIVGGIVSLCEHFGLFRNGTTDWSLLEKLVPFALVTLIGALYTISYQVSCRIYEKKEM